jgi:hypothetical protein
LGCEVFRRIFQKMVAHHEKLPKDFHGLTSVALMEPAPPCRIRKRINSASAFPKADVARAGFRNCA